VIVLHEAMGEEHALDLNRWRTGGRNVVDVFIVSDVEKWFCVKGRSLAKVRELNLGVNITGVIPAVPERANTGVESLVISDPRSRAAGFLANLTAMSFVGMPASVFRVYEYSRIVGVYRALRGRRVPHRVLAGPWGRGRGAGTARAHGRDDWHALHDL